MISEVTIPDLCEVVSVDIMVSLILSLTLPVLASGLEIVTHTGEEVGVRTGEVLELSCGADVEYWWCYWEHDGVKYCHLRNQAR